MKTLSAYRFLMEPLSFQSPLENSLPQTLALNPKPQILNPTPRSLPSRSASIGVRSRTPWGAAGASCERLRESRGLGLGNCEKRNPSRNLESGSSKVCRILALCRFWAFVFTHFGPLQCVGELLVLLRL